jgi:hypothetical protein
MAFTGPVSLGVMLKCLVWNDLHYYPPLRRLADTHATGNIIIKQAEVASVIFAGW